MALLVADCPRCNSTSMTFDVTAQTFRYQEYGWSNTQEVFSVCRGCHRPSIFVIQQSLAGRNRDIKASQRFSSSPESILKYEAALNHFYDVRRFINLRDNAQITPPEYLPADIKTAFEEGAACLSIKCYNAASCMFRLCLDLLSRPLLPDPADATVSQPSRAERRNLGPRLTWLFDQGRLPQDLRKLASSVKDDGNDGAHAGTLSAADAEDLLDFTVAILERLITEPEKVRLAEERRLQRRQSK